MYRSAGLRRLIVDWVIKATRLCNLRCRYCYEWEHLSDGRRLPLPAWQGLLRMVSDAYRAHADAHGPAGSTPRLIWHGGEPLALPQAYFEAVVAQQREILDERDIPYRNLVQTNLYAPKRDLLEYLVEAGFELGVSFDFVPGARITGSGRFTEDRVMANVELLRKLGAEVGFITVVGAHNVHHLTAIYEAACRHGFKLRLLPLFDGPPSRPMAGVELDTTTTVSALFRLFKRWLEDDCRIRIEPFDDYLTTVIMHKLALQRPPWSGDPATGGGCGVMTVDPAGYVYRGVDASRPEAAVGHVARDDWQRLRAGASHEASLSAAAARRARYCAPCRFRGACDGYPLEAVPAGTPDTGCGHHRLILEQVDQLLDEQEVGPEVLGEMLRDAL